MARSANKLLSLCSIDIRAYLGTIRNWAHGGPTPTFVIGTATPEFRKTIHGLVSFHNPGGQACIYVANVNIPANFSIEVVHAWDQQVVAGDTPGRTFFARRISDGNWTVDYRYGTVSLGTFQSDSVGGNITIPTNKYADLNTRVVHSIARRTGTTGDIVLDGVPALTTPTTVTMGTMTGACNIGIGAQDTVSRPWLADIYLVRFYNDYLTNEECSVMYERSRALIQSGAPKRSGIFSRTI